MSFEEENWGRAQTQTYNSCRKTEAEMGGMRPPDQGRLELQELEEAGRCLPGACAGSTAPGHLDLGHLASRTETGWTPGLLVTWFAMETPENSHSACIYVCM